MGLLSPQENSELGLIRALLNLGFCATVYFEGILHHYASSFALSLMNTALLFHHRNKIIQMITRSSVMFIAALHSQCWCCRCCRCCRLAQDPLWRHVLCFAASFSKTEYDSYGFCTPSYMDEFSLLQISDTDDLVRMSSSVLASLGVGPEKENLYPNLLAAVKENNLGRDVVTCQFISEISDMMGAQGPGVSAKNPGLMTRRQACHVLAFIVDQVKFPSEDFISEKIKTKLWHKKDIDKLKVMMKEGSLRPSDPWPVLGKVFSTSKEGWRG